MSRRSLGISFTIVASVAACSVLNSPEDLKPVDDSAGGTSSIAGSQSSGKSGAEGGDDQPGTGGATATGGTGGTGGTGVAGCGPDCVEGGAPPIGKACTDSAADCASTAPICDAQSGECRPCASDPECSAETDKSFCITKGASQGRCVACRSDTDCTGRTPVCTNAGTCRACNEDAECASGACEPNGACASPDAVVYALAETGVSSTTCGSQDEPCRNLSDATAKLTATRRTLVLIATPKAFNTGVATFPAVKGLRVVGNGDTVLPYDGKTAFVVPAGAEVAFSNVVVSGSTAEDTAGIQCNGGSVAIVGSVLKDNGTALLASDCDVVVTQSLLKHNASPLQYGNAAIKATCTTEHCTKTTSFLRNRFEDNGVALSLANQAAATIENNLFLRNGSDGYTRVLELRSDATRFAYNTLVENFNGCTYVGIVACIGPVTSVANISFNNFPGQQCQDQVWYSCEMSYSLTEVAYPGSTNKVGDPKFVDAANGDFAPGEGSPAIDKGNPKDTPPLDLRGNKRPVGNGPDIGAIEAQ